MHHWFKNFAAHKCIAAQCLRTTVLECLKNIIKVELNLNFTCVNIVGKQNPTCRYEWSKTHNKSKEKPKASTTRTHAASCISLTTNLVTCNQWNWNIKLFAHSYLWLHMVIVFIFDIQVFIFTSLRITYVTHYLEQYDSIELKMVCRDWKNLVIVFNYNICEDF